MGIVLRDAGRLDPLSFLLYIVGWEIRVIGVLIDKEL
jgi:hypothetical protein